MLMTKIHPPESIVGRRAERDGVAPERFADTKDPSTIRDFALGLDLAHDIGGAILNGRQAFGEPARTRLIARRGDGHRQGFMGAVQVIEGAPAVKVLLAVRQIEKEALVEQFRFEGAMKAFVFAQRLGMRGPGMADRNAEADAPDGQGREGAAGPIAPGGAVIHQQAGGQAIPPEGGDQVRLDRGRLFIGTGLQTQGKPGTVIQDGQGVTAAGADGEMAFEIHLPQGIGRGVFEALPGLGGGSGGREAPVSAQNGGNGARRRDRRIAQRLQAGVQLPAAPRRMRRAEVQNRVFQGGVGALGHLLRPPRPGLQPRLALGRIPGQPFIPGLGADGERATQGADVAGGLHG